MTDNDNIRLDQIAEDLESQGQRLVRIEKRFDSFENTLTNLVTEIKIYDSKLDTYQKASQQIVNIAFGLLATSALAIIIPAVLNR
jgi:septal ring factor EnvC (AmiA/AmiB activator)